MDQAKLLVHNTFAFINVTYFEQTENTSQKKAVPQF
jgi:hypothetical protein